MKKSKRLSSFLLLLLVFFILVASVCFVLHESHHECERDDCQVCRLIVICRDNLKSFALTLSVFIALFVSPSLFTASRFSSLKNGFLKTPVSLKVRLLN